MPINVPEFYNELCRLCEKSWQACGWESEDTQYAHFALIGSIISPKSSVLDVGCGQGDFFNYIKHLDVDYLGIDFSNLMIAKALEKFPKGKFVQKDFFSLNEKFDFIVASGPFNFQVNDAQYDYIQKALEKCFENCNKSCAIALTSELADTKYQEPIFYYCPKKILSIALDITPYVILNTSSLPNEMMLFMFRSFV